MDSLVPLDYLTTSRQWELQCHLGVLRENMRLPLDFPIVLLGKSRILRLHPHKMAIVLQLWERDFLKLPNILNATWSVRKKNFRSVSKYPRIKGVDNTILRLSNAAWHSWSQTNGSSVSVVKGSALWVSLKNSIRLCLCFGIDLDLCVVDWNTLQCTELPSWRHKISYLQFICLP